MTRIILAAALALAALTGVARAQQASPQETIQALQGKLQDELNQDMEVRALLVKTQAELAAAQKEISDSKKTLEPTDKK